MKEHLGGGTHKKGHDLRRVLFCDKVPQYRYFKFSSGYLEDHPTGLLAGGAFAPYERFAAGKTSAQAEFISAEHVKVSQGTHGAPALHGTGPTMMGPMMSKMFIAGQGSFRIFRPPWGRRRARERPAPIEGVHFMRISLPCQVLGKRPGPARRGAGPRPTRPRWPSC